MNFSLDKSIEILTATPLALQAWLGNLSDDWLHNDEGENTWSPYEVVSHLVTAEKTNWIPRMNVALSDQDVRAFTVFARMEESRDAPMIEVLREFSRLRAQNIGILKSKNLTTAHFDRTAVHPEFGEVNLSQLLATWTAHDLVHIAQIARVMARQYTDAVGPWTNYLTLLKK